MKMETKKVFKMSLAQPELLRDSIKVLSGLISEARLHISEDGLRIVEMDSANVGMTIWQLIPSACVEYELNPSEQQDKDFNEQNEAARGNAMPKSPKEITIG